MFCSIFGSASFDNDAIQLYANHETQTLATNFLTHFIVGKVHFLILRVSYYILLSINVYE